MICMCTFPCSQNRAHNLKRLCACKISIEFIYQYLSQHTEVEACGFLVHNTTGWLLLLRLQSFAVQCALHAGQAFCEAIALVRARLAHYMQFIWCILLCVHRLVCSSIGVRIHALARALFSAHIYTHMSLYSCVYVGMCVYWREHLFTSKVCLPLSTHTQMHKSNSSAAVRAIRSSTRKPRLTLFNGGLVYTRTIDQNQSRDRDIEGETLTHIILHMFLFKQAAFNQTLTFIYQAYINSLKTRRSLMICRLAYCWSSWLGLIVPIVFRGCSFDRHL